MINEDIKKSCRILRQLAESDDYDSHAILLTKEANEDYAFFINQLGNVINNLGMLQQNLVAAYKEKIATHNDTMVNCTVYRCDFCKNPCDFLEDSNTNGCFKYADGHQMPFKLNL